MEYFPVSERNLKIGQIIIHQRHFTEINSTQTWSKENVKLDSKNSNIWELITADKQTAGIGTHNRKWVSHVPGNVYASLTFQTEIPQYIMDKLSALAVLETLQKMIGNQEKIRLKWPNDVVIDGKKISGSMPEISNKDGHNICTLGVGINVNLPKEILDSIKEQKATSMFVETGKNYDEKEVIDCFLHIFIELITNNYVQNPNSIFEKFNNNMTFIGESVKVHDDSQDCFIEGFMDGVTEEGILKLRVADGQIKCIKFGTLVKKDNK